LPIFIQFAGHGPRHLIIFPRVPSPLVGVAVSGHHAAAVSEQLAAEVSGHHAAAVSGQQVVGVSGQLAAAVSGQQAVEVSGHHTAAVSGQQAVGVFGHHAVAVSGPHVADALALAAADAKSGHPAVDDPYQYDYTVLALYHPSSHADTNHNGPNAVYDPMSASCYRNHCSVSDNIRMARSEYIPAV
jgi:hypothetical protein